MGPVVISKYSEDTDYGYPSGGATTSTSAFASMGNRYTASIPLLVREVGVHLSSSGVGVAYDAVVAILDSGNVIVDIQKKSFTGVDGLQQILLDEPVQVLEGVNFWVVRPRIGAGGQKFKGGVVIDGG